VSRQHYTETQLNPLWSTRGRPQASTASKRPHPHGGVAAPPYVSVKRSRSADDANYCKAPFPDYRPAHSAGPALYCSDPGLRGPGILGTNRCDTHKVCDASFGTWRDGPGRADWWGGGHGAGPCGCESGHPQSEPGGGDEWPGAGHADGEWRGPDAGPGAGGRSSVGAWNGVSPQRRSQRERMNRYEWLQV
jgi:hypothetical protein